MYLTPILERKRARWAAGGTPAPTGRRPVETRPTPSSPGRFRDALRSQRSGHAGRSHRNLAVIAEFKPRSPSKGQLRPPTDVGPVTRAYVAGGAAAISVLADDEFFGGSPDLVRAVAADPAVTVPVLYKDFLIDTRQIALAEASGADGVLLIVRAVDDAELTDLTQAARAAGLDPVHECHDEEDLDRALAAGASIVGINNRDLETFAVDLDTSRRLRALVPDSVVTVSESGLGGPADAATVAGHGFDACLVGETLLGTPTDRLPTLVAAMAAAPRIQPQEALR